MLVCDADDAVTPGWVSGMASALESFDIVGGLLDYVRFNQPAVRAGRERLAWTELPIAPNGHRYAVGANIGFRRVVHQTIDGFDESFRIGSDEIDFCLRAQYAGFSIGLAPDAVIHYRLRTRMRDVYRQDHADVTGFAAPSPEAHRPRHAAVPGRSTRRRSRSSTAGPRRCGGSEPDRRGRYARDARGCTGSFEGFLRYRVIV